jgi:multisubunit Na+/H+ antiporter MnhC subunit
MPILRGLLRHFGIDRAVSYAMAARSWQIPSGVVTTLLIALCFTPDLQGVYYLILTLTGLQAFLDAGLINTLLHAASHDSADTRLDDSGFLRGSRRSRGRIAGLIRFAAAWFASAALVLVGVGSGVGIVLLKRQNVDDSAVAPLILAMVLAALALLLSPMIAILEGCGQVKAVNRSRLGQAVLGSFVVWACLVAGAELWTAAAAIATQLAWEIGLVFGRYRNFFVQLHRTPTREFDWRTEIWPLQWRIGVQSMARYLAFLPILPVLFDTQGPEVAGRYGMTWQVMSSLLMVAYAYVRTRSPDFGRLIALNRRSESYSAFKRVTVGSTLLLVGLVGSFCFAVFALGILDWPVAQKVSGRFLSPLTCLWFAMAVIPMHTTQCFAMYIRSQKFDPIWRVNLPACSLLALLAYLAARSGQVEWIAASMAIVFGFSTLALALMWRWYHSHFQALES